MKINLWAFLITTVTYANNQESDNCFSSIFSHLLDDGQPSFAKSVPASASIKLDRNNINIEDAKKIDLDEITDLHLINRNHKDGVLLKRHFKQIDSVDGFGFWEIHSGFYRGRKVFLKTSPLQFGEQRAALRTKEILNNEVSWVNRLDKLHIGPKFHGFGNNKDGHYVIVTDFVEGYSVTPRTFKAVSQRTLPQDFTPTESLFKDLEKIKTIVEQEQIVMNDLQLKITAEHALIIDPELFKFAEKPEDIAKCIAQIDLFIQELKKLINMP